MLAHQDTTQVTHEQRFESWMHQEDAARSKKGVKLQKYPCSRAALGGQPFMTFTPRVRGQNQVDSCGRGREGSVSCGRPHRNLNSKHTYIHTCIQTSINEYLLPITNNYHNYSR